MLPPSSELAEAAELVLVINDTYILRLIAYGTLALLVFDILLTLGDETACIWRRPWSLFKTLYIITRYVPVLVPCIIIVPPSIVSDGCNGSQWLLFYSASMMCSFPLDCLLAMRLDRLYSSRLFRKVLILSLTAEAIALIIMIYINGIGHKLNLVTFGSWMFCVFVGPLSVESIIVWTIPLIITILFFCFAVVAFYKHLRQRETLTKHRLLRESGTLASIFTILFRDNVISYSTSITTSIIVLVLVGVYIQSILAAVPLVLVSGTSSIIGTRLVLALKGDPGYATGIYQTGTELHLGEDTFSGESHPLGLL